LFDTRVTGCPITGGVDDLDLFDEFDTCVSKLLSSSDRLSIEAEADRLPEFRDIASENQIFSS
jgi:hypothetical protein